MKLVLILPKINEYARTFNYKEKNKNNKLISFCIGDDQLLEKYKTIWTKIDDLKNIELNALPVYDDSYLKTKVITYDDKVYIPMVI